MKTIIEMLFSIRLKHGLNGKSKAVFLIPSLALFLLIISGCNMQNTEQASTESSNAMEASSSYITQSSASQAELTPDAAVTNLKDGNKRFVEENMIDRDLISQVKQTSDGQYPFAAVVSCIDSRIPTEIIFDQGVGDIFNARIAGNFVNQDILGSLEFACKVAGSKAIVVMGHTSCGAVKGAVDNVELGNLTAMLEHIQPAIEEVGEVTGELNSKNTQYVQQVSDKNVELTIQDIKDNSPVLNEMYENGEILIVGAMYDVETGKVNFME